MSEIPESKEKSSNDTTMDELKYFLDVPIKIRVELGNRSMKVRHILQLQPKSIVELPKSAGENVDILMNERLIAFGEVMEMEGSTGIRLTDLNIST
jgi:flagellar motor switch protein FliN/FliY